MFARRQRLLEPRIDDLEIDRQTEPPGRGDIVVLGLRRLRGNEELGKELLEDAPEPRARIL
jgi:hypothetical protein